MQFWEITCGRCSISCATLCWMSCAVFFFRRPHIFDRPKPADLLINLHEGSAHFLITAKLRNLLLGFSLCRWAP